MKNRLLTILVLLLHGATHGDEATPATRPTLKATETARQVKARIKSFRLTLWHHGEHDKPYYALTLTTGAVPPARTNPFHLIARISEEEATRVVDQLAVEGFLDRAIDPAKTVVAAPATSCYTMSLISGEGPDRHERYASLGWNLPLIKRLEGLREVLDNDAAVQMDVLLERLEGHRKDWEKAALRGIEAGAPAGDWDIKLRKQEDRATAVREGEKVVISISSRSGIGGATIEPRDMAWPRQVVLRLHLRGLESFAATSGKVKVSAAFDGRSAREHLWADGREGPALDPSSRFWMPIQAVDESGKPSAAVPLRGGSFEITVPKAILDEGRTLSLEWIDFYRG